MKHLSISTQARRRAQAGFNLIEVLVALAIFVIGFSMVAGVVPAGHLLVSKTEGDIVATIAAKNMVAVVENKKIFVPGFEHSYMHDLLSEGAYRNSANQGMARAVVSMTSFSDAFGGVNYDNRPNDGDTMFDQEDSDTSYSSWTGYIGNPCANYCRGFWGAPASFRWNFDTNDDGNPGDGYNGYQYSDATDMPLGRIHSSHRRTDEGALYPMEQLTYPSFIADTSLREMWVSLLICDVNANAANRNWVCYAVALRRRAATWPERKWTNSAGYPRVVSNNALLRSPDGNMHPNNGWPLNWGYWNSYCVTGENTNTSLPGLYNLPMIVYDWNKNLIEVAYPPCFLAKSKGGITENGETDRRMVTGDKFISREAGVVFTVLSTRDVDADAAHQLVEVYPPLNTTLLGPNTGGVNCDPNWRLREGFFAPRPAEGGQSPLIRVEIIPAARGFTSNPNH